MCDKIPMELIPPYREFYSVDLTEDEDSSSADTPFDFVDCSSDLSTPTTAACTSSSSQSTKTPVSTSASEPSNKKVSENEISQSVINLDSKNAQTTENRKLVQFTSVQIRPPVNSSSPSSTTPGHVLQATQIASPNSAKEVNSTKSPPGTPKLPLNPQSMKQKAAGSQDKSLYSPKQPPGKVVIIKKNNKYYKIIIPHNVMPNINQSMGPVLINIPEVGPLVISNDPESSKLKPNHVANQQLSLNLDAMEKNLKIPEKRVFQKQYEPLRDKKFCWTYATGRKRDIDGFTNTDRLGFGSSEYGRAKKCDRMLWNVVRNCERKLKAKIHEHDKFRKSLLVKNKVKLVKINRIIEGNRKTKEKLESPKKHEIIHLSETDTYPVNDDYGSDLLVTKKVVMLDSRNEEIKVKHRKSDIVKKSVGRPKKTARSTKKFIMKPCEVLLFKDERVEKAYRKYRREMGSKHKSKTDFTLKSKPHHNSLQPKLKIKPPPNFPVTSQVTPNQSKWFENIKMILKSRIIDTEQKLKVEISNLKSVLVVTDLTIGTMKNLDMYCTEFSKYNIVYVVKSSRSFPDSILENEDFISAVELGYVKLVDTYLFSKYAKGGMKFSSETHRAEHNYCVHKK